MKPPPRCTKHNCEMEWQWCQHCAGNGFEIEPDTNGDDITCEMCGGWGGHWSCPVCREEVVAGLVESTPEVSQ